MQWRLIQIKANSEDEKKKAKEALDGLGDPQFEREISQLMEKTIGEI